MKKINGTSAQPVSRGIHFPFEVVVRTSKCIFLPDKHIAVVSVYFSVRGVTDSKMSFGIFDCCGRREGEAMMMQRKTTNVSSNGQEDSSPKVKYSRFTNGNFHKMWYNLVRIPTFCSVELESYSLRTAMEALLLKDSFLEAQQQNLD